MYFCTHIPTQLSDPVTGAKLEMFLKLKPGKMSENTIFKLCFWSEGRKKKLDLQAGKKPGVGQGLHRHAAATTPGAQNYLRTTKSRQKPLHRKQRRLGQTSGAPLQHKQQQPQPTDSLV